MKEVFIGIGIELGYLIGLPCVTVMGGWRIVFGVAVFFVLIMKSGLVSPAQGPCVKKGALSPWTCLWRRCLRTHAGPYDVL